tara:strand:+ start:2218 stop:3957 length:1740 start_codon:yes stop_codon:yes gene_type:complete
MSDFFVANDKIPISQQSVAIPSENGLNYNSTQTIEIQVPPNTEFINPKASCLQFNVKITPPSGVTNFTRLQLDSDIGAQCLIKDIRIYDGNRNTLLEEVTDYNTWVSMKYDYESNQSLRNKRALTEGSTVARVETRGTAGSSESCANDTISNPYFKPKSGDQTTAWAATDFLSAKVNLPLHTGLFQNDRILPVMLLNGLHISITLEDDYRVFRQLDGVLKSRRTTLNPIFLGTNGSTSGTIANGSAVTTFHLNPNANNQWSVDQCPFVVGELIGLFDTENGTTASFTGPAYPKISSISACTTTNTIILTTQSVTNATGGVIDGDGAWVIYSQTVEQEDSYDPTYTVSNVELILEQVMVPPAYKSSMMGRMKEGGSMSYDFTSVTNYRYSQLASDRVANIRIPIDNSRCKSILCVPTDSTVYTGKQALMGDSAGGDTYKVFHNNTRDFRFHSGRSGLVGVADHISNYVFMYEGRLQPSRNVNSSKTGNKVSISQQGLIELDKALSSAGINTHSMRKYNENFVIGRALALGSGVYDARGRDFSLQVNYQETNAPAKGHLWKNYVVHIRRLVIDGDTVRVEI